MSSVDRSKIGQSHVPVRLQKLLAQAGIASRRACETLIKDGRVSINGVVITQLGSKAIPEVDQVMVDGKTIHLPQKVLYLFHKPRGVITSMKDTHGRACVGDMVRELPNRVFPVGRLDQDVSGLLLLTNDGEFAQRLTHPRYEVKRTYIARVKGTLDDKRKRLLESGIMLPDGFAKATSVRSLPQSKLSKYMLGQPKPSEDIIEMIVSEGRNHFVKNILDTVGLPVEKLSRTAFGPFRISNIPRGSMRQIALKEELYG